MSCYKNFKGIEINRISPADPNDLRGPTYETCKSLLTRQVTVCARKKGSFSSHYHKGKDPSKNPEIVFLARGKIRLMARNPEGQTLDEVVEEGHEIIIQPNVLHGSEALTDVVSIELRKTFFDKEHADKYSADTYEDYVESLKNQEKI